MLVLHDDAKREYAYGLPKGFPTRESAFSSVSRLWAHNEGGAGRNRRPTQVRISRLKHYAARGNLSLERETVLTGPQSSQRNVSNSISG
jgi:hypothetical protein